MQWLVRSMRAELGAPASPLVFSSDAEGVNNDDFGGYGVVGKHVDYDLAEDVILAGTRPGHTVARLDGRVSHLNRRDREIGCRILCLQGAPPASRGGRLYLDGLGCWPLAAARPRHPGRRTGRAPLAD